MAKTNINILFFAINLYHSTFLCNADPDLDENSGGSTNLEQKIARIGGFPSPYSPPSIHNITYILELRLSATELLSSASKVTCIAKPCCAIPGHGEEHLLYAF